MDNRKRQYTGKERPIVAYWHKHKKGIIIATGIAGFFGAAVLTVFGVKYYWNSTAFERWFRNASLDDLKEARDNIHAEYMKHNVNDEYRESLWNILPTLDKKISEIEWDGKKPSGPTYYREHGSNLYKRD